MSDKISDVPERVSTRVESVLSDAALNLGSVAYEEFKALKPDPRSSRVMEASGVLPSVELFDSRATTQLPENEVRSDRGSIADTQPGDNLATQLENTQDAVKRLLEQALVFAAVEALNASIGAADEGTKTFTDRVIEAEARVLEMKAGSDVR